MHELLMIPWEVNIVAVGAILAAVAMIWMVSRA